jgi:hypothetical protein
MGPLGRPPEYVCAGVVDEDVWLFHDAGRERKERHAAESRHRLSGAVRIA